MQQQDNVLPQLKPWLDRMAPVVEQAKESLGQVEPAKLVQRSGCGRDEKGNYQLLYMGAEYLVSEDDFTVRWAANGEKAPSFFGSIILTYLATADGTPPSRTLVGFRELPDGMFYAPAFQSYSGDRLVRELSGGVQTFRRGAELAEGERLEMGDAAYLFDVLPRIRMGVVYWESDEDFPAQAQVLFEDTAPNYMPNHGLAILGSQLVSAILKAAGSAG